MPRKEKTKKKSDSKSKRKKHHQESSDIKKLSGIIGKLGFTIQEICPDGNCLFRAFAAQHCDDQDKHLEYRQAACDYIEEHFNQFKTFIADDEVNDYSSNMSKDAEWGTQVELFALCKVYRVDAIVFQADGSNIHIKGNENETADDLPVMLLAFHDDCHFNSVIYRNKIEMTLRDVRHLLGKLIEA
jgi:OTU-like cysteine protease